MNIFQAILLGVIQGVAEFLPISSSGHMMLFEQAFGLTIDPSVQTAVTVLMHVGTLAAVIIVLWPKWLKILRNLFHSKTLLLLIIASVPALIFKVLLGDAFDRLNAGGFLGIFFLVTAVLMYLVEKLSLPITDSIYDWMTRHGIEHEEKSWEAIRQMFFRQRKAYRKGHTPPKR